MTRRFGLVALVLVTLYGVLFWSFVAATGHGGLLTPEGAPSTGVLVLGLAVLLLRIGVLFVLLPVAAYRLVAAATNRR